jgi:hypothetical protein
VVGEGRRRCRLDRRHVQAQATFGCNSPWWFDWHDALMQRIRYYGNGWYETIA